MYGQNYYGNNAFGTTGQGSLEPAGAPKISTLQDNFDETEIDSTKWVNWGYPRLDAVSGELYISTLANTPSGYYGMYSANNYDATSDSVVIKLVDAGDQSLNSFELFPLGYYDSTNSDIFFSWFLTQGKLEAWYNTGTGNQTAWTTTYDDTVHVWLRIRESGGTVYYETSADGTSWTTQHSMAVFPEINMENVKAFFLTGTWDSEAVASEAYLDNYNIPSNFHSIEGTLLLGGQAGNTSNYSSSISGTLLLGGSVDGTVQGLIREDIVKQYTYKVYDPDTGDFMGEWTDVASDFKYSQEINSSGSAVDVELARNSDSVVAAREAITDDSGVEIITDSNDEILAELETTSSVGPGTLVDLNLNVVVTVFTEESPSIEGKVIFTGYISKYVTRYGRSENTIVTLLSHGAELDNYVLEFNNDTRLPFYSRDPSTILIDSIKKFNTDGGLATTVGNPYRALTFNGTSDYVPLPSSVPSAMGGLTTYTIAFWFRVPAGAESSHRVLLGINNSTGGNVMWLAMEGTQITLDVYHDTAFENVGSTVVTDGNWHSCLLSVSTGTATLYVDNVLQSYSFTLNSSLSTDDTWQLGMEYDNTTPSDYWDGDIDGFAVWSRELTGAERITFHGSKVYPTADLEVHYEFDNDIGPHIVDESTNNRDATAAGDGIQYTTGSETYTPPVGGDSVDLTTTTVTYTFNVNTFLEVIRKCLELAPQDWYWYYDMALNIIHFHEKGATPDHYFVLGEHIIDLDLEQYIEDITNVVYFTGGDDGGGSNLFKKYTDTTSINDYRRGLLRISDARVKLTESADILSQTAIDRGKEPRYRTSITISDKVYDIESIVLGQTIGFRNFGNFVDGLIMQVVRIDYNPDSVRLQLDTLLPSVPKRLEDVKRNLQTSDLDGNPDAPA